MKNNKINFLDLSKISPKLVFTKSGNKTYKLNIAYSGEKILISKGRDRHYGRPNEEFLVVPKDQICLWYKWSAGRNQHIKKNIGLRFNYVLLPKYVKLDKLTLNALGLLQAEMTKHTKRASNIIFTNSESALINAVLKFFERLFISTDNWSWSISFNFKLKNNESKAETNERENKAIDFWTFNSSINLNKKQKKCLQYTGNRKYVNMRPNSPMYGSLRVGFSNIIIYQLILNILDNIKEVIKTDKKFIKYYMQGIIAGEGCVKLTAFKSVDSITIGCCDTSEKNYYKEILELLNIFSFLEKNEIRINNLKNFIKIYYLNLIDLNPTKKSKFYNGLISFKQIPESLKKEFYSIKKEVIHNASHKMV